LILQAGDLIAQSDECFGQRLKAAVIVHLQLDFRGLVGGHPLGKFLALEKALQDVIGAEPDIRAGRFEKLLAQSATPKLVDGFHLQENGLALLKEIINWGFHGHIVSYQIQYASTKALSTLLSSFGLLCGHTPRWH
jgi:hypothetical protein